MESRNIFLLGYNSNIFRMLNIVVVPSQQEGGLEGCQEPVLTPESRGTSSTLQMSRYPQSPAGIINCDRMTLVSWHLPVKYTELRNQFHNPTAAFVGWQRRPAISRRQLLCYWGSRLSDQKFFNLVTGCCRFWWKRNSLITRFLDVWIFE